MRSSATTVTYSSLTPPFYNSPLSYINNGDINDYFGTTDGSTTVIIDLGSVVTSIKSIKFWHYWQDSRTYYNVQLMTSSGSNRWKRVYGPTDAQQSASGTEILLSTLSPLLPSFVIPSSYSFDIQPSASYPDDNNDLTDGIIASAYCPSSSIDRWSPPWVGWFLSNPVESYNPTITFNFGRAVSISKVSIHFQGDGCRIYLPVGVTISGTTFTIGDLSRNGWFDFDGSWSGESLTLKVDGYYHHQFCCYYYYYY